MTLTDEEKETWIVKCAAQYVKRAEVTPAQGREFAEITYQSCLDMGFELGEPEDEADNDMAEWTDDEGTVT